MNGFSKGGCFLNLKCGWMFLLGLGIVFIFSLYESTTTQALAILFLLFVSRWIKNVVK